jgi:hypothetical protein
MHVHTLYIPPILIIVSTNVGSLRSYDPLLENFSTTPNGNGREKLHNTLTGIANMHGVGAAILIIGGTLKDTYSSAMPISLKFQMRLFTKIVPNTNNRNAMDYYGMSIKITRTLLDMCPILRQIYNIMAARLCCGFVPEFLKLDSFHL